MRVGEEKTRKEEIEKRVRLEAQRNNMDIGFAADERKKRFKELEKQRQLKDQRKNQQ